MRQVLATTPAGGRVLLHYSPFAYAHRGVPVVVPWLPLLLRLRGTRCVVLLHEMAFDWRGGLRGWAWAVTQRAALVPLVLGARALVVTTEDRAAWLRRRTRRPVSMVCVPSSIPAVGERRPRPEGAPLVVGLFGWGTWEDGREAALDALASLAADQPLRLLLAGEDRDGRAAAWRAGAARRGCKDLVETTGTLEPAALSAALSEMDVYLHLDPVGPTSRRSALSAALEHGLAIVAVDGPQRWAPFADERPVRLVDGSAAGLASALGELLDDPCARADLGRRARRFHDRYFSREAAARVIGAVLEPAGPTCAR